MQMLETAVVRRPGGTIVEFRGEGGERISVDLHSKEDVSDDSLIQRARAMLIQAANFGLDQQEAEQVRPDRHVPDRYVLEYVDQDSVRSVPVSLPNMDAVRDEVRRSARDLLKEALLKQDKPSGWAVRALDGEGNIVFSISYEDILNEEAPAVEQADD